MAAPVRAGVGDVVAALSISGPETRLTRERIAALQPVLLREAATVSARLGYGTTTQGAA
jgi:DNA-binding IclR family transcriptional regulator